MKKYLAIFTALSMLSLVGCSTASGLEATTNIETTKIEQTTTQADTQTETNTETNTETDTEIVMNTTSVVYPTGDYLSDLGESTTFSDGDEILITNSGTYEFSGDYVTNTITVNVNKDIDEGVVYLVLNNANITSDDGTPINIIEAKDVVIILEGENNVIQGEIVTTDEEFPSGAIYSKADTVITGDGSLTVTTLYNDGINGRDDLIIEGTTITVNAVADGILGKDLLAISESDIIVTAGKDGLKTSNSEELDKGNMIITSGNFTINAQNDGISSDQILQIDGGTFDITSGGGFVEVLNIITQGEGSGGVISVTSQLEDSMKGLKGLNIILNDGEFTISSYEDAIHSDYNLTINGGIYNILSGDDALHADIDLVINDIDLVVENAYEGIEGSTVTINGGNILVNVLDDAMNANSEEGFIKITDGTISLKAQGDGIDSNGDLIIEGGEIIIEVNAIYSGGDSELDVTGVYMISGGTVVDENGNEVNPTTQGGRMNGGGRFQNPQTSENTESGVRPQDGNNNIPTNRVQPQRPTGGRH